jgi:tmRNA-binding protein
LDNLLLSALQKGTYLDFPVILNPLCVVCPSLYKKCFNVDIEMKLTLIRGKKTYAKIEYEKEETAMSKEDKLCWFVSFFPFII